MDYYGGNLLKLTKSNCLSSFYCNEKKQRLINNLVYYKYLMDICCCYLRMLFLKELFILLQETGL